MKEKIAPRNVADLYDVTNVTPCAGIEDYTDGIYKGDSSLPHNLAQKVQHNYLLDEIKAKEGFKLLEVGCGLGTLLQRAKERKVHGIGITISDEQVQRCRDKGLEVYLLNYIDLPSEWNGKFDGIIANGSLEHFCQPEDVLHGNQNKIYANMFSIFARLIDSNSDSQRVATTSIHFRGNHLHPQKLLKNPFLQLFDAEGFHSSVLYRGYGGYYPVRGQLRESAKDYFSLLKEVDGTEDYRITSEHWTKKYNKALFTNPRFIRELFKYFLRNPIHTFWASSSFIVFRSWLWQFRKKNPRTVLYRHTWIKNRQL